MEEKEEGKELEVKKETPLARVSGKEGRPLGGEEVDIQTDVQMPRVAILQGLSQIVIDGKGQVGQLADSLSKEIFGEELIFSPLFLFKTRIMFVIGEGLVMKSANALTITQASPDYEDRLGKPCDTLPEAQWTGNEPPKLSLVYNFPAMKTGRVTEFPISISLMRTSAKAGRTLVSLATMANEDWFSRKYRLFTKIEKGEKGTFAIAQIELVGRCTDEEYAAGKKWYEILRGKAIDIDMEAPDHEEI